MPKAKKDKKDIEKSNAQDLADRIRRHKLQKEQEHEEEEEEKRRRKAQEQDTEEDDENLKEDEDNKRKEDRNNKKKDKEDKIQENEDKDKKQDKQETDKKERTEEVLTREGPKSDTEIGSKTEKQTSNVISKNSEKVTDTGISFTETAGAETTTGIGAETAGAGTTTGVGAETAGMGTATGVGAETAGMGTATAGTMEVLNAAGVGAETAGTGTATGVGATTGAAAGSAGAAAGAGAAGTGIIIFGIVLIVILIIIVVIGILFFFITMPGMVVGKIGDAINSFREDVEAFMNGDNASEIFVNRAQVLGAAEYLNQMGYDLDGFGFLDNETKKKMTAQYNEGAWASIKDWWSSTDESNSSNLPLKEFNTKTLQERKSEDVNNEYQEVYLDEYSSSYSDSDIREHILLAKDADGEITFAKSKYLATYLSAENAIYLIRNDNTNIFNRAAKLIGMNDATHGSGLTYFINASDRNIKDYISNADGFNFKNPEGWFGYNRVNIFKKSRTMIIKNEDDGWFKSTNYTYSLNGWASKYGVPLQLSLALHLSSLAPDFALDVATRGAEDTTVEMGLIENNNTTTKAVLYIDLGNGKQYYRIESSGNKYRFIQKDGNVAVFEGTDSKGYFELGENKVPVIVSNAFEGKLNSNEIEEFIGEVVALNIDTEGFTKYIPIILGVQKHWYQDLDFKGCYEYTGTSDINYIKYTIGSNDSSILQKVADTLYVEETSLKGTIEQTAEPKIIGEPGEWIKELIDNNEYYKYDGTRKSEEKSKIDFKDTAVDAIAMLEQIQGEDSQDIIRMFRELMASYDIVFEEVEGTKLKKELFANVIKNYSGTLLTDGEDCVYRANIPPMQTGFDENLVVQAPCKGRVTYKTNDAVCIEIEEPSKDFNNYTILISGFKVEETIGETETVQNGTKLGETIKQDLKLVLRDENGAIVKNKYGVDYR